MLDSNGMTANWAPAVPGDTSLIDLIAYDTTGAEAVLVSSLADVQVLSGNAHIDFTPESGHTYYYTAQLHGSSEVLISDTAGYD